MLPFWFDKVFLQLSSVIPLMMIPLFLTQGGFSWPGPRFTNCFSIAIQIWWKFRFTLTSTVLPWSLQNFVHGTCKSLLRSDFRQGSYGKAKFPLHLNCGQKKNVSETGPWSLRYWSPIMGHKWDVIWNIADCLLMIAIYSFTHLDYVSQLAYFRECYASTMHDV